MTAEHLPIDSRVLGGNVLNIQNFDPSSDFQAFESAYVAEYDPVYASCKIPLERVNDTHALEDAGFRFIECQMRYAVKLRKPFDVSKFGCDFVRVTCEKDLEPVLAIAATSFTHERFCVDNSIGPELSGTRFQEYVRKSFHEPNEAVYRLVDRTHGLTVGFKTHQYLSNTEVRFLLGGIHPDYRNLGFGLINEYFELNEVMSRGATRGITHVSAANYPVFNLNIGNLGFQLVTTFAVFRKLYGAFRCRNSHAEAR